jgi:hypothetical protein
LFATPVVDFDAFTDRFAGAGAAAGFAAPTFDTKLIHAEVEVIC